MKFKSYLNEAIIKPETSFIGPIIDKVWSEVYPADEKNIGNEVVLQ